MPNKQKSVNYGGKIIRNIRGKHDKPGGKTPATIRFDGCKQSVKNEEKVFSHCSVKSVKYVGILLEAPEI